MAPAAAAKGSKAPATASAPSKNGDPPTTKSRIVEHDAGSSGSRKPDAAAYNAEQEEIKKEIDALGAKLVRIRAVIYSPLSQSREY